MAYKVTELARLSGVSARTLRYYDQIGLLRPERDENSGYRTYGEKQVNRLQQILFYREMDVPLEEIGKILNDPAFDCEEALEHHLCTLLGRKERIEGLIQTVTQTIRSMKAGTEMNDPDKFEAFKKNMIQGNSETYGQEITEKYGSEAVQNSNARLAGMTEQDWKKQQELSEKIFELLNTAMKKGDPAGREAQEAAELHKQWLVLFWGEERYSKKAHRALTESYVSDSRFTAYYDSRLGSGAAEFLRDAVSIFTK